MLFKHGLFQRKGREGKKLCWRRRWPRRCTRYGIKTEPGDLVEGGSRSAARPRDHMAWTVKDARRDEVFTFMPCMYIHTSPTIPPFKGTAGGDGSNARRPGGR
jgi:hypothetical protein